MTYDTSTEKVQDKSKIKKSIFIFIIAMLIVTFLSNTIGSIMLSSVKLGKVSSGILTREISGEGSITARDGYEGYIKSQLIVIKLNVKVGQSVKKGQIIATLDTSELKRKIKNEEILKEQKLLALKKLKNEEEYNKSPEELNSAKEELDYEKRELDELKNLYDVGAETADNVKKSQANVNKLQNQYNKVISDSKKENDELSLNIKNAQLEIQLQENSVAALNDELVSASKISVPANGIITELNFSAGMLVDSSKPFYKMSFTSGNYELKSRIIKTESNYLSVGDPIKITITSNGTDIDGKVTSILKNDADDRADIIISIRSDKLKGGEYAQFKIIKKSKHYDILIPNAAIHEEKNSKYVYVIKEEKSPLGNKYYAEKATISCGDSDYLNTAVINGLNEFDRIIIDSDRPIQDAEQVKLIR